jgi:hypothetical protein
MYDLQRQIGSDARGSTEIEILNRARRSFPGLVLVDFDDVIAQLRDVGEVERPTTQSWSAESITSKRYKLSGVGTTAEELVRRNYALKVMDAFAKRLGLSRLPASVP